MIDFACKQFKLDEIVKCGLGLTKADYKIMNHLMQNSKEWNTSQEISKKLKLDISTVQRSIKRLFEKDLVLRIQNNLDSGGYVFIYQIKNKKEISSLLMKTIHNWTKKVEDELLKW